MSDSLRHQGLQSTRLLSMGSSRQKYWGGSPCLPPGDLPKPGTEPSSPALQVSKTSRSIKCPYLENGGIVSYRVLAITAGALLIIRQPFFPGCLHMHAHSSFSVSVWRSLARPVCLAHTRGRTLLSNSQLTGANLNQ